MFSRGIKLGWKCFLSVHLTNKTSLGRAMAGKLLQFSEITQLTNRLTMTALITVWAQKTMLLFTWSIIFVYIISNIVCETKIVMINSSEKRTLTRERSYLSGREHRFAEQFVTDLQQFLHWSELPRCSVAVGRAPKFTATSQIMFLNQFKLSPVGDAVTFQITVSYLLLTHLFTACITNPG